MRHPIYRIQDSSGRGPWKPGFSKKWVITREDHESLNPIFVDFPAMDWEKEIPQGHHLACGCFDVNTLRLWVNETEYKTLLDYGYRAVKIIPDRILASNELQCVFCREKPLTLGAQVINLYPKRKPRPSRRLGFGRNIRHDGPAI